MIRLEYYCYPQYGYCDFYTHKGECFQVSIEDIDLVDGLWYMDRNGYVYQRVEKTKFLHRVIVQRMFGKIPPGYEVDHINCCTTDNCRDKRWLAQIDMIKNIYT